MPNDEAFVNFRNNIPRMWYNLYQGCLDAGFNRAQSFQLLQTFILSGSGAGSVKPENAGEGPESDKPE